MKTCFSRIDPKNPNKYKNIAVHEFKMEEYVSFFVDKKVSTKIIIESAYISEPSN
jgi:hypothetical protein